MWCDDRSIHSTAERGLSAPLSAPLGLAWHAHRPTARSARSGSSLRHGPPCCFDDRLRGVSLCASLARLLLPACLLACLLDCIRAHWGSSLGLLEDLPMLMADSLLRGSYGLLGALWEQSLCACMREDLLQWVHKPFLGDLRRFGMEMD